MNEVRVFNNAEFGKIKEFQKEKPNPVVGIVYAIEYNDRFCKIGMSSVPSQRTSIIKHYISDYMQEKVTRIMISFWHTNYRENEKKLHEAFKDCRLPNTELFSVSVDEVVEFILDGGITFDDKSMQILEEIDKGSKWLIEFGESVMRGDFDQREESGKESFYDKYENMLRNAKILNDEIKFKARAFIEDYEEYLELKKESKIMRLKGYFFDKWVEYGLVNENGEEIKNA